MIDIRVHGGGFAGGKQNTKRLLFPQVARTYPIHEDVKNEKLFMLNKSSSDPYTMKLMEYSKEGALISENSNYVGGNKNYTARLSSNSSTTVSIRDENGSLIRSFTVDVSVLNDSVFSGNSYRQIHQVVYIPATVASKRLYLVLFKIRDTDAYNGGAGYIMVYDYLGNFVTTLNQTRESIEYMTISPLGKLLVYYTNYKLTVSASGTIYQFRQVKSNLTLDEGVSVSGSNFQNFGMAALSNMTEYYLRNHKDNILG